MKKFMLCGAASIGFFGAAFFTINPVFKGNAFSYTVKKFTVKPAYANTICPATGTTVPATVHMDLSESGPCSCPTYYNGGGLVSYPFSGFKCFNP